MRKQEPSKEELNKVLEDQLQLEKDIETLEAATRLEEDESIEEIRRILETELTEPIHPSELVEVLERLKVLEADAKSAKILVPDGKKERLTRFTNEMIAAAINTASGNIAEAARILGCHYSTVYRRIEKVPELAQLIQVRKEQNLDELEMELFKQAKSGNISALIFALKTQGYKRGYGDRSKLEVDGTFIAKHERERNASEDAAYLRDVLAELNGLSSSSLLPSGSDDTAMLTDVVDGEFTKVDDKDDATGSVTDLERE